MVQKTNSSNQALYSAYKAKDARFDGKFFIGISTTGIYCRPICRAKQPQIRNCNFYTTAAEAEQAGYRPCLLCRPELAAPGTASVDAKASLALRAAKLLEENCGNGQNIEELAKRLGCTARHLRRTFISEYKVSPIQYLQTCRLLLAKNLLTDTKLSVLDVAMAAGFGSLRRFNDLFKKRYNFSPTSLRKKTVEVRSTSSDVTLALGYRPPYQWEQILGFLDHRAIPGVEVVRDNKYMRTVQIAVEDKNGERKYLRGWVQVGNSPVQNALKVTISSTLLSALPQILAKIRHLFDLYCAPEIIDEALASLNDIRTNLCVSGIRLPGCFDPFEMSVRAVLGQQITVKAARTLAERLAKAYGTPLQTGIEGLNHIFPSPDKIIELDTPISEKLGSLGIISTRARTILALAKAFDQKNIDFELGAQPELEIKRLLTLPGIGNWTANYIAMRTMGWTDAFLETDAGIKKALSPLTEKEMLALSEKWRPWRSYATINLWNSLYSKLN